MKALRILSLFSRDRPEWRVGELSAAIGTANSTVSRIAHTLESQGFLAKLKDKDGYRLGLRLWELGSQAIGDHSEFPQRSLRYLEALVSEVNESVHAAILDGIDVLYVQKVDAQRSIRAYIPLGGRFPPYCTATGKAILAFQSDAIVNSVIQAGLKPHTDRTITSAADLRQELARVRRRGYAMTRGEWRADVGGIGAPVYDRTGRVMGAIGTTMPLAHVISKDGSSPIIRAVMNAAAALSQELGFIPQQPMAAAAVGKAIKPTRRGSSANRQLKFPITEVIK
jgi:DNA-binding IclR family transcriptional regulator